MSLEWSRARKAGSRSGSTALTPAVITGPAGQSVNPTKRVAPTSVKEAMEALGSGADFTKATVQTSWYLPLGDRLLGALSPWREWLPHWDTGEIPSTAL